MRPRGGSSGKAPSSQPPREPPVAGPAGIVASAHAAGHRPVLPRPPPPEHQPSTRSTHSPSMVSPKPSSPRRYSHGQLFSPYGRAYEHMHPSPPPRAQSPQTVQISAPIPIDSVTGLPDFQPWPAFSGASPSASVLAGITICGCGPNCACPGCFEHRGRGALSSAVCANPDICMACLDCLPNPLSSDDSDMAYSDSQSHSVDEWLRQMASMQAQSAMTPDLLPSFARAPGPVLPPLASLHHAPISPPRVSRSSAAPAVHSSAPDMPYDPAFLQTYALWSNLRDARADSQPAQGEWDADPEFVGLVPGRVEEQPARPPPDRGRDAPPPSSLTVPGRHRRMSAGVAQPRPSTDAWAVRSHHALAGGGTVDWNTLSLDVPRVTLSRASSHSSRSTGGRSHSSSVSSLDSALVMPSPSASGSGCSSGYSSR